MASFLTIDGAALRQIDDTIHKVDAATRSGHELGLRFDNHWAEDTEQPALLAAALMANLADRRLLVDVVDQDAVERLMRYGVAAAFWRRPPGRTRFTTDANALDEPGLGAVWTVGSRATIDAMFGEGSDSIHTIGPRHATFVNPHLSSGEDGLADVVYLIGRWLTRRLPGDAHATSVDDTCITIGELLANVHEHAAGAVRKPVNALVRIAIDDDAVRCSVTDTGVGVCVSVAAKLDCAPSKELLGDLLSGKLPRWHHGRGVGIARIVELVQDHGGRLSAATATFRADLGSEQLNVRDSGFDLQGTVIDLAIPLASW